jgi:uncharacterized metal-binding protein
MTQANANNPFQIKNATSLDEKDWHEDDDIPIVYACSGCSNMAQVAHDIALIMHATCSSEMSSTSGIDGNVESIIEKTNTGRDIIAIYGCNHQCTKECLLQNGLQEIHHFILKDMRLNKTDDDPISLLESAKLLKTIHLACGLPKA